MQILVYPANYSGDVDALPVISVTGGALIIPVGLTEDEELRQIFEVAASLNCQWVQILDKPVVRDEVKWIDI